MHRRDLLAAAVLAGIALPAAAFEREGDRRNPVFLLDQPVATLDPHAHTDWTDMMVRDALYEGLARHEGNPATVVPCLAAGWTVSDDGLTWTFRLNPAATFANGDKVDGEAARVSWLRALGQPGTAWMLRDNLDADGIKAPDAQTLVLTLKRPMPALLGYLPHVAVFNPRQVPGDDPAWLASNAAGSGPFRVRRREGRDLVLDAVANHWRPWPMAEAMRPGAVVLRVEPDHAARQAAFAKGDADLIGGQPGAAVPGAETEAHTALTQFVVMMNTQAGPTADLNLRRALAYLFPYPDPAPSSPFPPGTPGVTDVPDMPERKPDIAKEYAGKLPNGGVLVEYVHVAGHDAAAAAGKALAEAAQPLGITVQVTATTWPDLVARGAKPETAPHLAALLVTPCSTDPDAVASLYASCAAGQYWGMHHLRDEVVDKLVGDARSEPDEAKRLAIYGDVQRLLVATQPAIFAGVVERHWTHRGLGGVVTSPVRGGAAVDLRQLHVTKA